MKDSATRSTVAQPFISSSISARAARLFDTRIAHAAFRYDWMRRG